MHGPVNVKLINKSRVLKYLALKRYVMSSAEKKDIRFRKIFVEADSQTTV